MRGDLRPVLLGGYAAKQCARRVHNDWDATIPAQPVEPSPQLQALLDSGIAFEEDVRGKLVGILGDRAVDFSGLEPKATRIERTVRAMSEGAEFILGGQLPDDLSGGRTGRPDILLRVSTSSTEAVYVPGDIKAHRTSKPLKTRSLRVSWPGEPVELVELPGFGEEIAGCFGDFVQLAHYSRMIDAAGFGPSDGSRIGFIIGTDDFSDFDPSGLALVWHDLNAPHFTTFSRTHGTKKRSAMERYDHEHGFRLAVAEVAARRSGAPSDPEPLVRPIGQDECTECPWSSYCFAEMSGEASADITAGRLDVREWLALSGMGVTTTEELAALDIKDERWVGDYLAEVTHQKKAFERLATAVERASMIVSGEDLRRTTAGPIEVPSADVEIDFDIEWDSNNVVYLWGARIRQGQDDKTAVYVPFVDWQAAEGDSEVALADRFVTWMRQQIKNSADAGRSLNVFHYSHPERSYLTKILGEAAVEDVLAHFVDLLPLIRQHFLGAHGLSIKKTAPAFGFEWRDDDPGGLQSQVWLLEARSDGDVAKQARNRILAYNEDDVAATAALRDGLRASELSQ